MVATMIPNRLRTNSSISSPRALFGRTLFTLVPPFRGFEARPGYAGTGSETLDQASSSQTFAKCISNVGCMTSPCTASAMCLNSDRQ